MPYKNPEVRRAKAREYTRLFRLRMPEDKKQQVLAANRKKSKEGLANKTPKEKKEFYKKMYVLARKRGRYKNISAEMVVAYHKLRERVISFLGGRCSSINCKWLNEDGTFGCTLKDCLQVDHVYGGGRREKEKGATLLRKVLRDTSGAYQLLCSNCNWLKRIQNGEIKISPHRPEKAA